MDWVNVLETFVATIAGAIIAISAILIQRHFDERKGIRQWFESSYIEQGIDVVMGYTANVNMNLARQQQKREIIPIKEELPLASLDRLKTVVNDGSYTVLLFYFKEAAPESTMNVEQLDKLDQIWNYQGIITKEMLESLKEVRKVLLDVKLKRKLDLYRIGENAIIKAEVEKMRKLVESVYQR